MEEKRESARYSIRGRTEESRSPEAAAEKGGGTTRLGEAASQPEQLDQGLMFKAQQGDPSAVAELYDRYQRKMLNYLYRITGNQEVAEDMVQETFVRVVRHLHSYRPTGSVGGWIYRIARNLALNELRYRRTADQVSLDEPLPNEDGEGVDRAEVIPCPGPKPDEEANRNEVERTVQEALLKISPAYREALILCDIQGHSYKEACEILHCPIDTVASRLARGRGKLAELLGYWKKEKES